MGLTKPEEITLVIGASLAGIALIVVVMFLAIRRCRGRSSAARSNAALPFLPSPSPL